MFDYKDLKEVAQGYAICFLAMWCGLVFGMLIKASGGLA